MASVHKQRHLKNWFVAFAIWNHDTGRWQRCFWSAGTQNKHQAKRICKAWNKAAQQTAQEAFDTTPKRRVKAKRQPPTGALSREAEQRLIADGVYEIRLAAGLEQ